ncbi:MAG TPA: family 10 glycosylhydrolase, partial [Fimbriimonadaceae bacterium]|nr:family 10 glycosylhydrolase [Fimbriimonadaceae bacterium]
TDDSIGLAQQATRGSQKYQARIIWIDGTANIDKYNSEDKIVGLVKELKDIGFNTIVFDVKPISGQVVYKSKFAPRLTEWKGQVLPADLDPLAVFCREARKDGISLFVSLNAFSEGHNLMKTGPAFTGDMAKWQSVLYETKIQVRSIANTSFPVSNDFNKLPPADGSMIAGFNDPDKLPPPGDSFFWVAINRGGVITQSESGSQIGKAKIPNLGSILIGVGPGADFLRQVGYVNLKLAFDTTPDFVPAGQRPEEQIPLMVNPLLPAVQDYEKDIVKEILSNYDVDGIIYDDRLRFAGMNADFSDFTEAAFEKYLGRRVVWPDDVFKFTLSPGLDQGVDPGPYYDAWMTWRAQVLRNYVMTIRQTIKSIKPAAQLGVYAGSWYGEYPRLGQNWASPTADAGFWFMTPEYAQTGIAPLLDFLITGCYYPTATIRDAMRQAIPIGFTIESAGQLTNRLVRDQTWTYAGISLDQFRGNPEGLGAAIQAACGATQGVMVFDLSHDFEGSANVFRSAFQQQVFAPHQVPGLLTDIRNRRAAVDKLGQREPTIIISGGASGTGQ